MRTRNLVLGSAAGFITAGLLMTPCFAQSLPRYPTPSEQAQTDSLNARQASEPGIISSAAPQEAGDIAAYNESVEQANAQAQARYDTQLQDYQNRKDAYEAECQSYRQDVERYPDPPVIVEEHHVIVDRPDVVTVEPERDRALAFPEGRRSSLVAFDDIASPDSEIGGAPVRDRGGYMVGNFRHLTFQDGGREKAVITLRNNKSVAVDDDHLRFDPEHDTIVADLTFDELNHMPARF